MRILLTRPVGQAAAMREALVAAGHDVLIAPMLTIEPRPIMPDEIMGASALIATSANAFQALAASSAETRDAALALPLFAVGKATAKAGCGAGFREIVTGPGTGAELLPVILARHAGSGARLVHLSGDQVAFDLVGALVARGVAARRVDAYRAVAAQSLPTEVAAALAAGDIDAVVLLSPRSAATFLDVTARTGLADAVRRLKFYCLSDAVAAQLGNDLGRSAKLPLHPETEEMLALIGPLAANSGPSL